MNLIDQEIKERYLANENGTLIAKDYGCNNKTIYRHLEKMGVPIRTIGESNTKDLSNHEIKERYLNGDTAKIISIDLGCSDMTIFNRLKKMGVSTRTSAESHMLDLPNKEIAIQYIYGMSINMLARYYKCDSPTIRKRLKDMGIELRTLKDSVLRGEDSPGWKGGVSFGRYCQLFNEKFREYIRDSWNRKCFFCGKSESDNKRKLSVHHVNYNKDCLCGSPCEFIPLCMSCHAKTNNNRKYWEDYIMNILYTNRYFMVDI